MEFKEYVQQHDEAKKQQSHIGQKPKGTAEVKGSDKTSPLGGREEIKGNAELKSEVTKAVKGFFEKTVSGLPEDSKMRKFIIDKGLDSDSGAGGIASYYLSMLSHILYDDAGRRVDLGSQDAKRKAKPRLQKLSALYPAMFYFVRSVMTGAGEDDTKAYATNLIKLIAKASKTSEGEGKDVGEMFSADEKNNFSASVIPSNTSADMNAKLQDTFNDIQIKQARGNSEGVGDALAVPKGMWQKIYHTGRETVSRKEYGRDMEKLLSTIKNIEKTVVNSVNKPEKEKKIMAIDTAILDYAHETFGSTDEEVKDGLSDPKSAKKMKSTMSKLVDMAIEYGSERGIFTNIYQGASGKYGNISSMATDILGTDELSKILKKKNVAEVDPKNLKKLGKEVAKDKKAQEKAQGTDVVKGAIDVVQNAGNIKDIKKWVADNLAATGRKLKKPEYDAIMKAAEARAKDPDHLPLTAAGTSNKGMTYHNQTLMRPFLQFQEESDVVLGFREFIKENLK